MKNELDFEIGDTVIIDDFFSNSDECVGVICEDIGNGIFGVRFPDGSKTYHERQYLWIYDEQA